MSNALKCDICGQFYDIKSHVDNAFVFFRTDSLGKKLYMESAIKYLLKLKSEGTSYKYIDEKYIDERSMYYTPYIVQ